MNAIKKELKRVLEKYPETRNPITVKDIVIDVRLEPRKTRLQRITNKLAETGVFLMSIGWLFMLWQVNILEMPIHIKIVYILTIITGAAFMSVLGIRLIRWLKDKVN